MCVFCKLYGEGQRWYLNPENYGRHMYRKREPGAGFSEYGRAYRGQRASAPSPIECRNDEPEKFPDVVRQWWQNLEKQRPSQVVTLADTLKILDLSHPVAALWCECRRAYRGWIEDNPKLYSCLGTGVGMFKYERWPERYKGGVDFMTPEEAKDWTRKWVKRGMVVTLMTYGAPYIGGICLCDYPSCGLIKRRLDLGIDLLKGHEVARVDLGGCTGCGDCIQRCQFGALKMDVIRKKAFIDMTRCFGCGLCADVCRSEAINLQDRSTFPGLKEAW
ncbi:MAG: 4Fe-4S binding protein [Chloroflexota bacterium]|nr:4Fe-4S binding protein [Chloroflexota bacterium]